MISLRRLNGLSSNIRLVNILSNDTTRANRDETRSNRLTLNGGITGRGYNTVGGHNGEVVGGLGGVRVRTFNRCFGQR